MSSKAGTFFENFLRQQDEKTRTAPQVPQEMERGADGKGGRGLQEGSDWEFIGVVARKKPTKSKTTPKNSPRYSA